MFCKDRWFCAFLPRHLPNHLLPPPSTNLPPLSSLLPWRRDPPGSKWRLVLLLRRCHSTVAGVSARCGPPFPCPLLLYLAHPLSPHPFPALSPLPCRQGSHPHPRSVRAQSPPPKAKVVLLLCPCPFSDFAPHPLLLYTPPCSFLFNLLFLHLTLSPPSMQARTPATPVEREGTTAHHSVLAPSLPKPPLPSSSSLFGCTAVLALFGGVPVVLVFILGACLPCSVLFGGRVCRACFYFRSVPAVLTSFWGRACRARFVLGACLPCSVLFGGVPAVLGSFWRRACRAALASFWGRACRARFFLGACLPCSLIFLGRVCLARFFLGACLPCSAFLGACLPLTLWVGACLCLFGCVPAPAKTRANLTLTENWIFLIHTMQELPLLHCTYL